MISRDPNKQVILPRDLGAATMTQPEVSMTPEEVLALIDDATEHSKIDMCADIAVSELREIRAAVAELVSENERARGALDGAVELAARLADERDALRRRVEELEHKLWYAHGCS